MDVNLSDISRMYSIAPGKVIHAGASYCQERDEYERSSFLPVIWLEALSSIATESRDILRAYPDQDVYNVTLWSENNVLKSIFVSSNQGESSSLFKFKWHKFVHSNVTEIGVESHLTTTLDSFLAINKLVGPYSLLVLDLQGAELHALQGSRETLNLTTAVYTEVALLEMYEDQPLFEHIHSFLVQNNFVLVHHDLDSSSTMGDALYVTQAHAEKFNLIKLAPPNADKHPYFYLLRIRDSLVRFGIPRGLLRNPFRRSI